jgi:hypothetical protein
LRRFRNIFGKALLSAFGTGFINLYDANYETKIIKKLGEE